MAKNAKSPAAIETVERKRDVLSLQLRYVEDTPHEATAHQLTKPHVQAAVTIQRFEPLLDVNALVSELRGQVAAVQAGKSLLRGEDLLLSQAMTLDTIFNGLARRAHSNIEAGFIPAAETFLRLALKAQAQSRNAVETLVMLKNPPVVFAKQANFAAGHQQVNNTNVASVGETQSWPNKLLEDKPHEQYPVDARAPGAATPGNPTMEAVDVVERAEVRGGESPKRAKRLARGEPRR